MAENLGKWASNRGLISKIRPSDGCKGDTVAILANRAWDAEVSRLQEVTSLTIRRFPPSDRQSALAWLESNT